MNRGVIRMPVGRTVPGWLATQIYKEALLEVKFTDTKGAPLEGASAGIVLYDVENKSKSMHHLVSNADGSASKLIEFGRCDGGIEALEFEHRQMGFNRWKAHYKLHLYYVANLLSGAPPVTPHIFYLGHICSQKVLKTTPFRND